MQAGSPRLVPRVTYRACLVGPHKQRAVDLSLDGTCFSIKDHVAGARLGRRDGAALIATIAFPYVHKICKASERGKSSRGAANCLDLVIHTKQGLRDLRLSLDSEKTVCAPAASASTHTRARQKARPNRAARS